MKRYVLVAVALMLSSSAYAQTAPKPCEELKSEIAQKLETNGVKSYTLDVIAKDKDAEGKVVGTCEGGTKKIVYHKEATPDPVVKAGKKQ